MFTPDSTNFASAGARHGAASWIVLSTGVVCAAVSVLALGWSWNRLTVGREVLSRRQLEMAAAKSQVNAVAAALAKPELIAAMKARRSVDLALRRSWTGFFRCLESSGKAVAGHVSVESLRPQIGRSGEVIFAVSAAATENADLIAYVRALKDQPEVTDAFLSAQRADTLGSAPIVRFQVLLTMRVDQQILEGPPLSKERI